MSADKQTIEEKVTSFYLNSSDYNGLSLARLALELGVESHQLLEVIVELVESHRISVTSPQQGHHHVKMFDVSVEEQLDGIGRRDPQSVGLYPTQDSVSDAIDVSKYDNKPFTKMMVLAAPQLEALPFSLDLLDWYERDPRYKFRFYDFGGTIGVTDEGSEQLDESERISFRFGVGYDSEGDRVVCIYVYRLAELPGKQQRIWQEFLVDRACTISDDFYRTTIQAQPAKSVSVYEATIYEQVEINALFETMKRPRLFQQTYEDDGRPRGFGFFMKPTQSNFDSFVHTMDKMFSDNIDPQAFGNDIERERRVHQDDGAYKVEVKGSLQLLNDWLVRHFPDVVAEDVASIMAPLREVRKLRQKPAHRIRTDNYDKKFYGQQDELVWRVYRSLKRLRQLLASDPAASEYSSPVWDEQFSVKSY